MQLGLQLQKGESSKTVRPKEGLVSHYIFFFSMRLITVRIGKRQKEKLKMATATEDESSAESTWRPDPTTPESRSLRGNSLDNSTPEETTTEFQARSTSQDSPLFPSPDIDPRLLHIPDLADVPMPEPSPNSEFNFGDTLGFDSVWPQGNLSPAETTSNDTNSPSVNPQTYSSPHHQFDQFGMPAPHDNSLPFPQVCTSIAFPVELSH